MTAPPLPEPEVLQARFHRLIRDLIGGRLERNSYEPWELDLLLDIAAWPMPPSRLRETLLSYRNRVVRDLENGSGSLLSFSDFMVRRRARGRERRARLTAPRARTGTG